MQSTTNNKLPISLSWGDSFRSLDIFSLVLGVVVFSLMISAKWLLPDVQWGPLSSTALHNLVILGGIFIYGLRHGFRLFSNPLIVVYTLFIFNTFSFASRHPDLSLSQIGQSYANFILGILLLHVNLTAAIRRFLWHMIPWMALCSVLVGLILHSLGFYDSFRYLARSDVYRLQGATTPKDIAQMAMLGMLICMLLARQHRFYLGLGLVNYGLIALTASRTNMLMGVLLIGVYLWPDIQQFRRSRQWHELKYATFVLGAVAMLTLANSPAILNRLTFIAEDSSIQTELDANSSGRLGSWEKYWDAAEQNILFGRGLGAGTVVVSESDEELKIPHNEYLRLIVDGGLIGLGLVILAYAYVFWQIIQHTTFIARRYLVASVVILAGLSLLDNMLTTQTFGVLFWVWWAIVAYDGFVGEADAPRYQFKFLKIYTGFPPAVKPENIPVTQASDLAS